MSFDSMSYFFYFFLFFKECSLLIYLFLAALGLRFCARDFSSCGERGGHSSSRCAGLPLSRPPLLRSTGSRRAGSAVVAHGPSCSAACGILPDQGSNPCPLHRQADSQPLHHQGSPQQFYILSEQRTHTKHDRGTSFQSFRWSRLARTLQVSMTPVSGKWTLNLGACWYGRHSKGGIYPYLQSGVANG